LIGVEVIENLRKIGKKVSLIELQNDILPIWDKKFSTMAYNVLKEKEVDIRKGVQLTAVNPATNELILSNGDHIKTDYLLVSVGLKPNTELLLAEGVEHLKNGALLVDEHMRTSLPGIYAAGDCVSLKNIVTGDYDYFPMGTHSNKGGRVAGANAAGGNEVFKGAYNTTIIKVFDYTLAKTGLTAKMLKTKNIPYLSSFFVTPATPSFYDNPTDLYVEVFYSPESKTLLGAEIFGEKGVDKRIDVLSTGIYAKLKMQDLMQLDLAYAPPFSPAKDAVITSGFIGSRTLDQQFDDIDPTHLLALMQQNKLGDKILIDVREKSEILKQGKIIGAINKPLDILRENLLLLDKEKEIIVYCQRGVRGYVAVLILKANGFQNVKNLAGGYLAWLTLEYPIEYINPKSDYTLHTKHVDKSIENNIKIG
ncbi:MAG: FAD-dependent oxidoreductase, partial [Bacteroidota bacterium]